MHGILTHIAHRCNEVGFFQEGAPKGHPTLVTRLVQPPYDERQCTYWFPEAYANLTHLPVPNVDATNKAYDGWFVQIDHLFFANGHRMSLFLCLSLKHAALYMVTRGHGWGSRN